MIPLIDLTRQYKAEKGMIEIAVNQVLSSGRYLKGKKLKQFEEEFATYLGTKYAIGVKSGTDAITIALLALGIKPGDQVIVPANACHSLFGIIKSGAVPLPIDIDPHNYNINSNYLPKIASKKVKAILFVHMYGNPKGVLEVAKFARTHKLPLLEDCAQAHGASISGKMAGTIGEAGIFSFYPTKNLACFSDGGAVVTNSPSLAERIRFIRENGENKRFVIEKIGLTSNLDEIQSAVLSLRLRFLNKYNLMRKKLARQLSELLKDHPITLPEESINTNPVYHMFTILTSKRNQLKKFLADNAITTDIHYPLPLHLQPALKKLGYKKGDFPNAERVCNTILTLPMYPFLRESEVLIISKAISKFFATPK